MLFNDNTTLTLESIRNATNISENELRRHLLSLCTPKLKILKKASKGKGIIDDDSFTFNDEFTSKFKRMKVPLISDGAGNMANSTAQGTCVLIDFIFIIYQLQSYVGTFLKLFSFDYLNTLSHCLLLPLSLSFIQVIK